MALSMRILEVHLVTIHTDFSQSFSKNKEGEDQPSTGVHHYWWILE
jgi:hypothetical protein